MDKENLITKVRILFLHIYITIVEEGHAHISIMAWLNDSQIDPMKCEFKISILIYSE